MKAGPISGGMDQEYLKIFDEIKNKSFSEQKELTKAAKEFVKLHNQQIAKAKKEYRYKSLNLAIISAWAFATGSLQKDKGLKKLYNIPEDAGKNDPLNGSVMARARHVKIDPDAYRGLGTRDNEKERGRLLQLFYRYSQSDKKGITLSMCNAAIKFYHYNKDKEKIKKEESAF